MNLDLATSPELVDELFKRYPDAAFTGLKDATDEPDHFQSYQRFHGHGILVQGMLCRLIRAVQDSEDYDEQTEEDL